MKILVTGCAGFIGSSLVDELLKMGNHVTGVDNFSTGYIENLEHAFQNENFEFFEGDLKEEVFMSKIMVDFDIVYHLSANADIRGGTINTHKDLEQNTLVTFYLLEQMRKAGVKKIIFASSAAVLGEPSVFPTPENLAFPRQTSLYGASKLACEGLISAYCEGFGFEGYVFRFVSILGPRYPHGHIYDFIKQLISNQYSLEILGNGKQKKSYLHINDCLEAIVNIPLNKKEVNLKNSNYEVYHLGVPNYCTILESASWICDELNLQPKIFVGEKEKGWSGDNPFVFLDINKAVKNGWSPKYSIEESIRETTRWLIKNPWIMK
jgi:UDP-glucose 4-epimerase